MTSRRQNTRNGPPLHQLHTGDIPALYRLYISSIPALHPHLLQIKVGPSTAGLQVPLLEMSLCPMGNIGIAHNCIRHNFTGQSCLGTSSIAQLVAMFYIVHTYVGHNCLVATAIAQTVAMP